MYDRWNLDCVYAGFDDEAYKSDVEALKTKLDKLKALLKADCAEAQLVAELLAIKGEISELADKLLTYISLRQATATDDGEVMAQNALIMRIYSAGAADMAAAYKRLGTIKNTDELKAQSPLIAEYEFYLKKAAENAKHLLSDEAEEIAAAMDSTGGSAWGSFHTFLTSTLKLNLNGKEITLNEARNLAYSADAGVRKSAYEAEINAYKSIQDGAAFALNNIKNQVTDLALKRGYESVLQKTLSDSRMQRKTLDAMLEAIRGYLPEFWRYFRAKARLLGYEGGLPWYEIFAPIGKTAKTYTPQAAREELVSCFNALSPQMSGMIERAFDESWIDFYPRSGKEGGAFCAFLTSVKQSRVLTNFDGTFGSVDTLAHELGHAFHNLMTENEKPLNRDYTMPIAETASTFNELYLGEYMLSRAEPEEKAALLDMSLREIAQCVVDIYSRYLFETGVFEKSRSRFLMADELNSLMLESQKQAYGNGLDLSVLNPGMWICKSHYYSSGISFYNFPYAFGSLFAQGLYALFKEEGDAFMPKYCRMLKLTGVSTIEQSGAQMGIDLSGGGFWKKSLENVKAQIDEFVKIADGE